MSDALVGGTEKGQQVAIFISKFLDCDPHVNVFAISLQNKAYLTWHKW